MSWSPLIGNGEQWPSYMSALLEALGDMPEGIFREYGERQQQAYVALHLQQRPRPLKTLHVSLNGTDAGKLARAAVEKARFARHPFFPEPVRTSPVPYGTEPDTLVVEIYPLTD